MKIKKNVRQTPITPGRQRKMITVITDDKGNLLTKQRAQKIVKDHVIEQIIDAYETQHYEVIINFGDLVGDSDEVTLGELLGLLTK